MEKVDIKSETLGPDSRTDISAATDSELYSRIFSYQVYISVAKRWLEAGIITTEEYNQIESKIAKNCGLSSFSIFREQT